MGYLRVNGYHLLILSILLHHTQPYRVRRAHLQKNQQQQQQLQKNQDLFQNRSSPRVIQVQRARNAKSFKK